MRYISLSSSSLTYFTTKGLLSELSGSSRFHVFNNEIVEKEKRKNGKIENRSALHDFLQGSLSAKMSDSLIARLHSEYLRLWWHTFNKSNPDQGKLKRLNYLEPFVLKSLKFGPDFLIKSTLVGLNIAQQNSNYQSIPKSKIEHRTINKTKVKGKMLALFSLKCSKKFVAFYSVSFPLNSTDDQCFTCWNYWLTALRKRFNLTNYVWVTERQQNGTLHFHMLTNNYMPILSVNRAMSIIINNQVLSGLMDWGESSLDKFNGVDVDSIFNSKRHKKTGKLLNQSELRNWVVKYITKYVTKNSDKFQHLCWHCSRSVSILFTSELLPAAEALRVTMHLPQLRNYYVNFKTNFTSSKAKGHLPVNERYKEKVLPDIDTWVFCFVPPELLFRKIRMYNNWIFVEHEPITTKRTLKINLRSMSL